MLRVNLILACFAFIIGNAAADEQLACGLVAEEHTGTIPEWPNDPVDFQCKFGFIQLSLCILNREGIEWLPNAGPDFVAINDGASIYALTRETHDAYPMIVKRTVVETDEGAHIRTEGCGYGDKAAADKLIADYKKLDAKILEDTKQ